MMIAIDESLLAPPLVHGRTFSTGRFHAMGSPCEILVDTLDKGLARQALDYSVREAKRIEDKFSRYRSGNVMDQINSSAGKSMDVDDETSNLIDFAATAFALSDGMFDVTTGVLRRAWRFDGGSQEIIRDQLHDLLKRVGWKNVRWNRPTLMLPADFEIDFGGICKEYAADRIASHLHDAFDVSVLVNLGGDITARGSHEWNVGIEDVRSLGKAATTIDLASGAIATSGDTKRFAIVDGLRLGHILDPRTGWPVRDTPKSVTVAASTCTEAGFMTTLAMLQGSRAESFLAEQDVKFWCYR